MRTLPLWAGLVLLTACPPPPEISGAGGEPSVEILFPPALNAEGDGPYVFQRDETGVISFEVVIDVDNLQLVDPYLDENSEPVDGQGHWHLVVNGDETPVPGDAFTTVTLPASDIADGQLLPITVALKQNDHSPLTNEDGESIEATVEVQLAGN